MEVTAPALVVDHVFRFFHSSDEEVVALRDVSLEVSRGEVVVVRGPSGSGKSTLLRCVCGIDDPNGGTVYVDGERLSRQNVITRGAVRARKVGYLQDRNNLFAGMTVRQNIDFAQVLSRSPDSERTKQLLDQLNLSGVSDHRPEQLSGGEMVRAALAVALANTPAVVVADEPTGELDGRTEGAVLDLLRSVAQEGVAILLASHSDAAAGRADRVLAMRDGALDD